MGESPRMVKMLGFRIWNANIRRHLLHFPVDQGNFPHVPPNKRYLWGIISSSPLCYLSIPNNFIISIICRSACFF